MNEEMSKTKSQFNHEWIKAKDTGNSYLCPVGSIDDKKTATDEQLQAVCVDSSNNPQND